MGLNHISTFFKKIKKKLLQKFWNKIKLLPGTPLQATALNLPTPLPILEFFTFLKKGTLVSFSKTPLIFFFFSCLKKSFNFKKNLLYCLKNKNKGTSKKIRVPNLLKLLKKKYLSGLDFVFVLTTLVWGLLNLFVKVI